MDRTGVLPRIDGGEGDVMGEAEAVGVGDCDDDGVFCTGISSSTVGEGPSVDSLAPVELICIALGLANRPCPANRYTLGRTIFLVFTACTTV